MTWILSSSFWVLWIKSTSWLFTFFFFRINPWIISVLIFKIASLLHLNAFKTFSYLFFQDALLHVNSTRLLLFYLVFDIFCTILPDLRWKLNLATATSWYFLTVSILNWTWVFLCASDLTHATFWASTLKWLIFTFSYNSLEMLLLSV